MTAPNAQITCDVRLVLWPVLQSLSACSPVRLREGETPDEYLYRGEPGPDGQEWPEDEIPMPFLACLN